ncbi:hypothetical protein TCON_1061 [Astathelohania contejeani]|uniref:Uncharacterized protein n=1 Tax=Astathelohania contejeani TaxID=164912 RepID=A0ABQ7HZW4_9MICR|nr:hypothetical protein TCON_1061 [Thelohania contejeani]
MWKQRKYDFLANELGLLCKAKTKIILYLKELNITPTIEAYIQSTVLKKTLETISLKYRRGIEDEMDVRNRVEDTVKRFGEASATGCQPQAIEKKDNEKHKTKP